MNTLKSIGIAIAGVVVGLLLGGQGGPLGSVYNVTERNFESINANSITFKEKTESITADNAITLAESGTTYYVNTNVSTSTLPAITGSAGATYKFTIASAVATNDFRIVSAEGDNIEGSLIVAGAVVDCDDADRVNFVTDGENLGDFVEVRSDGTNWFVTQSNVLTAAKLTCSG